MSQDPMVTALQGPQDPIMDALFQQPVGRRVLNPLDLMMKGQEMLRDPNRPQYDPTNVDRPVRWREHIAGDVVPGPSGWNGPPPGLTPYQTGGAAGMLGMTREGGPYAVDDLGVYMHPEAKRRLEIMMGPGR